MLNQSHPSSTLSTPFDYLKINLPPYVSTQDAWLALAEAVKPADDLAPLEAAAEFIYLPVQGGGSTKYDPERTPYFRQIAEAMVDPNFERVSLIGPAQSTGKTGFLLAFSVGYVGKVLQQDCRIIHMTDTTAKTFSKQDVSRLLRLSPEINRSVKKTNVSEIIYYAGHTLLIGYPAVSQLSGNSTPWVLLTDRDRMDDDVEGEGTPEDLGWQRTKSFITPMGASGCLFVESAPGRDLIDPQWEKPKPEQGCSHMLPPTTGIVEIYNKGDRRQLYCPCPECGDWFSPSFEDHVLPYIPKQGEINERAAKAEVICPNGCPLPWTSEQKREAVAKSTFLIEGQSISADGTITGKARQSKNASFAVPALLASASTVSLPSLVADYLSAVDTFERTGSEKSLKTFQNQQLGLPYMPKAIASQSGVKAEDLKQRASEAKKRTVPEWVRVVTMAVDVQGDRFECQAHGWGPNFRGILIDRFALRTSPVKGPDGKNQGMRPDVRAADWEELIAWAILKTYPLASDPEKVMQVAACGVDFHGRPGVSEKAIGFWRQVNALGLGTRLALLRGDGQAKNPITKTFPNTSTRTDRKGVTQGDVPVWATYPNHFKDIVASYLAAGPEDEAFQDFPSWLPDSFWDELKAEVRTERGWSTVRHGVRNEAFDLFYMNRALCNPLGLESATWKQPENLPAYLLPQDRNALVFKKSEVPPAPKSPGLIGQHDKGRTDTNPWLELANTMAQSPDLK